jgi:hypothetical protein
MVTQVPERAPSAPLSASARDVFEGLSGAALILAALFSPFLRRARSHWGLDQTVAERLHPGDELVPEPRWSWTHGIELVAGAGQVWPWVAQIGADRAGFYSYQWLENLVGCNVHNAASIHPEWELKVGQDLVLHPDPKSPRMKLVAVESGRYWLAHAPTNHAERAAGKPWATASWLFLIDVLDSDRCRLVSRYRAAYSDDLATRLMFGPTLLEPIGFAMDRRLLLGVKERVGRP